MKNKPWISAKQREDIFARLLSIYDQLSFTGAHTFDLKTYIGKNIVSFRNSISMQPEFLSGKFTEIQNTFTEGSKEWAVLGCCQNVLSMFGHN